MDIQIRGETEDIVKALTMLGASSEAKGAGFNPLLLKVEEGKISTSGSNTDNTAFVVGEIKTKTKGEGELIVDVIHALGRLRKFFSGGTVTLKYETEKGRLVISNNKKKSYSYPPAKGDCHYMELPFKRDSKGIILFGGVRPTTRVKIDAAELKQLPEMAADVEVDFYSIIFRPDGVSEAWVGDEGDKTQKPMNVKLDCEVKGKEAICQYSQGFKEVVSVLEGKVTLYLSTNSPVWILQELEEGHIEYIIAPRIEQE